jgi:hypothetical protein
MRKSRRFAANGFDALEGRVVLSHATAAVPGVIHGHKAQLVAADFASFQNTFNNTIPPIVKDLQNAILQHDTPEQYQDNRAIELAVESLVNGLGNQLAHQLHGKFYSRIRSVITGATAPSAVGDSPTFESPGSLMAILKFGVLETTLGSPSLVNNLVPVYQGAFITGHTATRVNGDFTSFRTAFAKTINPMTINLPTTNGVASTEVSRNPQIEAAIVSLVNALGDQLSKDLGPGADPTIRNLITGSSATSGVDYATGTPIPGSLLATLMSVTTTELNNNEFIDDLVLVYSGSSRAFT